MAATFTKPALSILDQIVRLIARGLVIGNQAKTVEALITIGYYRFSGYTLLLETPRNYS